MQIIFFKELIIILKEKWSYAKVMCKKVNDFSLSQKIGLIYK